ncbi:hypothetical protein HPP92_022464 [Vanilla planifolia]|uniref:Uncharacterized protein n=1 Tax=Vanilla planifolia TaxID=51239 RepID=A0A835PS83_VANPL|nr:hypothetical protein HPP92_022464 [Vanilla planifolia]
MEKNTSVPPEKPTQPFDRNSKSIRNKSSAKCNAQEPSWPEAERDKKHLHFYQTAHDMSFRPRTIEDLDTAPESFSLDSHRHLLFNVSTKCLVCASHVLSTFLSSDERERGS